MAGDRSRGGPGTRRDARGAAPRDDAQAALGRALEHARRSLAEAVLAARALADAASLAATGRPADGEGALGALGRGLDELAAALAGGADAGGGDLLRAVLDALDAEIARWEARAREDADARGVLRAYLGLREILWELGVRPPREPREKASRGGRARARRPGPRVQRVAVDDDGA
jgi:hypothetical protein